MSVIATHMMIQKMHGVAPDYGGIIENKDLPNFMQINSIKNSDTSQYTEPGSMSGGKTRTI